MEDNNDSFPIVKNNKSAYHRDKNLKSEVRLLEEGSHFQAVHLCQQSQKAVCIRHPLSKTYKEAQVPRLMHLLDITSKFVVLKVCLMNIYQLSLNFRFVSSFC